MVNIVGRRVFPGKTSMGDALGIRHPSSSTAFFHGNVSQSMTDKSFNHSNFETRTTSSSNLTTAKGMENWMVAKATTAKQRQDCLVDQALSNCVCVLYCRDLVFRDDAMAMASIQLCQGVVRNINENLGAETRY